MSIINFTAKDVLQGQPIAEGWYPATIASAKLEKNKGGDSINYVATLEIHLKGIAKEDRPTVKHFFSAKFLAGVLPFVAAMTGLSRSEMEDKAKKGEPIPSFDFAATEGDEVIVKIKNELFDGRIINKIDGWVNKNEQVPF